MTTICLDCILPVSNIPSNISSDEDIFETGKIYLLYCKIFILIHAFSAFVNMNTVQNKKDKSTALLTSALPCDPQTIKLRVWWAGEVLLGGGVKVVHLVRDPRASFMSLDLLGMVQADYKVWCPRILQVGLRNTSCCISTENITKA